MGRVIVVGSLNEDLVFRTRTLPAAGETVRATEYFHSGGWKGGNQAVAARRAGSPVVFIGATGDQSSGCRLQQGLADEGIDISAVATLHGVDSGTAVVTVDELGENHVVIAPGANDHVDAGFVRSALTGLRLGAGDVLVTGFEVPREGARQALACGRRAGAVSVLNPSPATAVDDDMWHHAPIVVCNRHEATLLTGEDGVERAVATLARLTHNDAIITLGSAGALASLAGRLCRFPSLQVDVVDTTGAGDTFCGVFAASLAVGANRQAAITQAIEAASRSVGEKGARAATP